MQHHQLEMLETEVLTFPASWFAVVEGGRPHFLTPLQSEISHQ